MQRLGLGSWMEEEGEYEGTGANEMLLEAASSVNKYWSLGFSDVFSAAGLCDRLVVCEGGVTDGTWRLRAGVPCAIHESDFDRARSEVALASAMDGSECGRALREPEEWGEKVVAGESHLMS